MRTIQPKILEISGAKLNGKKASFGNFGKFWEMLFLSLLEVAENSNGTFWLYGRREEFVFFDYEVFATQFCVMGAISPGAPNENIVQNHLNIALLNVF